MDLGSFFSVENLQNIGMIVGTIIAAAYTSYKTIMNKLNAESKAKQAEVPRAIKRQSDLDCSIIEEAEIVKEAVMADRVQVYEFHNGTHYANGRSALKTTCTYEVCRYGVSSCLNILSGVPLSVIPAFIKKLLHDGELYIPDIEVIKETMPSTYSLKKSMDISGFYDVIIHNKHGEPIGFVAVQFCNSDRGRSINKDVVKKFAWFVETKLSEMM